MEIRRIFLATPDRDEIEWLSDELSDYGRIVRTIESLDFFVPQWETIEVTDVIFMESVIRSDESFKKLILKIRLDRPETQIMLIYHRDDDEFIESLTDDGINCVSYMDQSQASLKCVSRTEEHDHITLTLTPRR